MSQKVFVNILSSLCKYLIKNCTGVQYGVIWEGKLIALQKPNAFSLRHLHVLCAVLIETWGNAEWSLMMLNYIVEKPCIWEKSTLLDMRLKNPLR